MARCLVARTALIQLRPKGGQPWQATVVFPARWTRSTLLRYCRSEHPDETVRIVEWHPTCRFGEWSPSMFLANPEGFADYRTGDLTPA